MGTQREHRCHPRVKARILVYAWLSPRLAVDVTGAVVSRAGSFEADVDFDNDDGGARRGGVSGRGQRGAGIGAGLMSDDQRAGLKKVRRGQSSEA